MNIHIIDKKLSNKDVLNIAIENFGDNADMVKGVADLGRNKIALGGELHADAEQVLLEDGSEQKDLWGFNLYPKEPSDKRVKYTSFINIRPNDGNRSIEVQSEELCKKIREIIKMWVELDD